MTAHTPTATSTARASASTSTLDSTPRSRKGRIALWALQIVTAALYLNGAVLKLTGSFGSPEAFEELGLGLTGMYLVGLAELAGGIGLLIPRLAGLAALCFVPMMAGAVVLEAIVHGPAMAVPPLGALVFVALLAWYRRSSTVQLARLVTGPRAAVA